jgi:hypothetical protein
MRGILTILLILITSATLFSQDHIITKKGTDIEVNITEIREADVTFTMFKDSSKTPYVMDKTEIEKIVFSNGAEERFANEKDETIINNKNNTNRNTKPDKIYTMDGRVIYCEVVEKKRFGVNYIPSKSTDNYIEYLANTKIDRIEYANGDVEYISGSPQNAKNRKDPKDFSYLSPHYISINVGPAIPFGSFGGIAYNAPNTVGVDVNFDATYYIFRGMGFGITGGYMHNPSNSFLQTQLTTVAQNNAPGSTVTVGGWNNAYILAGLGYYNEYRRFFLDYKTLFGAIFSYYPTTTARYNDAGIDKTDTYTSESISYMFGGQITARYFITRKFQVKFNLSTLFGRANYPALIRTVNEPGQAPQQSVASFGIQPLNLSWFNFSFGLAYTFGK